LLGFGAGLIAVVDAHAAELPLKAKPVEYVKVCSLYGAGFYYLPGTQTCIKLGGFLRAEIKYDAIGSFEPAINGANAQFFRAASQRLRVVVFESAIPDFGRFFDDSHGRH
jgi:hypothetical protein